MSRKIKCVAGTMDGLAAYRACRTTWTAFFGETAKQISLSRCRRHRSTASAMGALPVSAATRFGEIRSIDQYGRSPPDRLDFGDDIVAPHHIDGLEAQRFRESGSAPARRPELALVLDHPGSRWQADEIGQHQIGGWRIDAEHGELMDVAAGQRPEAGSHLP